jgi:hypothetical protein
VQPGEVDPRDAADAAGDAHPGGAGVRPFRPVPRAHTQGRMKAVECRVVLRLAPGPVGRAPRTRAAA